jgi:flagellar biosynthetic protein FliR
MDMTGWPSIREFLPGLTAFVIVLARALGLVWTAPGWGLAGVSARFRVMLALGLAAALAPGIVGLPGVGLRGPLGWVGLVAIELAIGVALGLSGALVVAGARQAGELIALNAGLAPASLLDIEPERGWGPIDLGAGSEGGLTPLGHLHGLVAMGVFLTLDGPLIVVRALAQSFRSAQPGLGLALGTAVPGLPGPNDLVREAFARVGGTLGLALQAAAPAGLALLLSGLALAWLSRSAAGRPLSGLDWPVRVALGLVVSALAVGTLATTFAAAWSGWAASIGGS